LPFSLKTETGSLGAAPMTHKTMYDKIWDEHVVVGEAGEFLLYGDIVLVHEGHNHAFTALDRADRKMLRPNQVFNFSDHYVPTTGRERGIAGMPVAEIRNMVVQ
jgi:3-isopropylmalate/(R)-2-methylmalate dehydratase large subunit